MMPRTKRPDNRRRHATYRRLVERLGIICGLRESTGGCATVSRLAPCEKQCQEWVVGNFVQIHQTLRTTLAMATNFTTNLWEISDLVTLLEDIA
jgi:hypothetical protein